MSTDLVVQHLLMSQCMYSHQQFNACGHDEHKMMHSYTVGHHPCLPSVWCHHSRKMHGVILLASLAPQCHNDIKSSCTLAMKSQGLLPSLVPRPSHTASNQKLEAGTARDGARKAAWAYVVPLALQLQVQLWSLEPSLVPKPHPLGSAHRLGMRLCSHRQKLLQNVSVVPVQMSAGGNWVFNK